MDETSVVPETEEQADELINEAQESAPSRGPIEETQAPAPVAEEYSFRVNGKDVKGTRDQVIAWAQRGYDAPNRLGEMSKKLQEFSQKDEQYKKWDEQYGPVDKYVRSNPQWWQHVNDQWQQLQKSQSIDPNNPVIQNLNQEVQGLKQLAETFQSERQQQKIQQEDAAYVSELESVKKQYPKVDFVTPDADGKSLEYKVLEYAQANGIRKFTTAYRDFYHDELVKIESERAKEQVVKDKVAKSKLGVIDINRPSTTKNSDSVKGKSYNDLEKEALREYGIT